MADAWKLHSVNRRRNNLEKKIFYIWNHVKCTSRMQKFHKNKCHGINDNELAISCVYYVNVLKPRQNCHHFVYAISKCIAVNENYSSVSKEGSINNMPSLVLTMAWHLLYKITFYIGSLHIYSVLYIGAGWFKCLTICSAPNRPICTRSLKS